MQKLIEILTDYNFWISFISVFLTILALAYTLYYWLLDHLSDDEAEFIKGREGFASDIKDALDSMKPEVSCLETFLPKAEHMTGKLEEILNYRFWARSRKAAEYRKLDAFCKDSRYFISTIRRSMENPSEPDSLVAIRPLKEEEWDEIREEYSYGLWYLLEFVENWR